MGKQSQLSILAKKLSRESPFRISNSKLSTGLKQLLSRGHHKFVIQFIERNYPEIAINIAKSDLIDVIIMASIKGRDTQLLTALRYSCPGSKGAILLANQMLDKNIDIKEVTRHAYDDLNKTKKWKNKKCFLLAKEILKFCEVHLLNHETDEGVPVNTSRFLQRLALERSIYISDINPTEYAGSSTRVNQICKLNNSGYLYTGNGQDVKGYIHKGIRVYPLDLILEHYEKNNQYSIFTEYKLNRIISEENFSCDLSVSTFRTFSEFCKHLLFKQITESIMDGVNIKNVTTGYAWNTFYTSQKIFESKKISTIIDMHDCLYKRNEDLDIFSAPRFNINREQELEILSRYRKVICINNADRELIKSSAQSSMTIYPSYDIIKSSKPKDPLHDILYIGGKQRANIDSIIWFIMEVISQRNYTRPCMGRYVRMRHF